MTIQECIDKWKRELKEWDDYGKMGKPPHNEITRFIKDLEDIRDRPSPEFTLPQPPESTTAP